MDINLFHRRIGHPSEDNTRKTAKQNNILLEGELNFCEGCAYGKAHKKNVNKTTETRSVTPYERLFIDISTIPHTSLGGSKNWIIIVDDATRYKWSFFRSSKDCAGVSIYGVNMGEASLGIHVVDSVFGRNIGRGDSLGTNHSYIPVHIYSAYNSPSRGRVTWPALDQNVTYLVESQIE